MDISKLKKDKVVPNYRKMCELLGENIATSNSKKAQFKMWECYFKHIKKGNSWKITKVYKDVTIRRNLLMREYQRVFLNSKYSHILPKFTKKIKIKVENFDKALVYIIQLKNEVYIGETLYPIKRFTQHMNGESTVDTKSMLYNGATFEVLWYNTDETLPKDKLKTILLTKEKEYINQYLADDDFEVLNTITSYGNRLRTNIKVDPNDFLKAIQILQDNGIQILNKGFDDDEC